MEKMLEMTTASQHFSLLYSTISSSSSLTTTRLPETSYNLTLSSAIGLPMMNSSELELDELEYIFDRRYVRIIFIVLYTIVFCFCFFGNLMVILVVTLHWKMSQTKICLANLAFADLTVGVFCVYQNLSVYLINSWMFGQFLCKMYHFVNSLSHTASILILVVICVERYLAILHPFKCKSVLTIRRLWFLIMGVWLVSAIYSSPKLYYIGTLKVLRMDGEPEIICTAKRTMYDSRTYDICHFFLLFLLPLVSMSIMYYRVGVVLWTTSKGCLPGTPVSVNGTTNVSLMPIPIPTKCPQTTKSVDTSRIRIFRNPTKDIGEDLASYLQDDYDFQMNNQRQCPKYKRHSFRNVIPCSKNCFNKKQEYFVETHEMKIIGVVNIDESPTRTGARDFTVLTGPASDLCSIKNHRNCVVHQHRCCSVPASANCGPVVEPGPINGHHGCRQSVRGIVKDDSIRHHQGRSSKCSQAKNVRGGRDALRIRRSVIKMLCVLIFMFFCCHLPTHLRKLIIYFSHYQHFSISGTLATPICNLIMYSNSALNPLVYSFLSKSFRTSFAALLKCKNTLELPNNEIASTSEVINLKSVAGGQEPDKIRRQAFKNSSRRNRVEFAHQI